MTSLSIASIKVPFNDDSIKIVGVSWTDELGLTVSVLSKRGRQSCEVYFGLASGMRMLHELDLASWWMQMPPEALSTGWLFQVNAGGWLEFESSRQDFYSKNESGGLEYLITGFQECLSVFSHSKPVISGSRA